MEVITFTCFNTSNLLMIFTQQCQIVLHYNVLSNISTFHYQQEHILPGLSFLLYPENFTFSFAEVFLLKFGADSKKAITDMQVSGQFCTVQYKMIPYKYKSIRAETKKDS